LKILYNENFVKSLSTIWDFIALDAQQRANEFAQFFREKIEILSEVPYLHTENPYILTTKLSEI
jgi:hypothetical protein